jgi:ABC-type uncharacterized transport system substrate-binding protein
MRRPSVPLCLLGVSFISLSFSDCAPAEQPTAISVTESCVHTHREQALDSYESALNRKDFGTVDTCPGENDFQDNTG